MRLAFRVSAIVVFDDQIVSAARERSQPWLLLSQAFARTGQAASFNPAGGAASVLLRPGAGAAALAGLIALAITAQLLSRQLVLDSPEFPILRALGMTRSRLAALSLARAAVVTITGAAAARWGLPSRHPRSCPSVLPGPPSLARGSRSTWPS